MEILYYVIIPIVSALIGGLFTFLGVRLSITNEQNWRLQDQYDKNKERNEQIITSSPELKIIEDSNNEIKDIVELCLVPYDNLCLKDFNTIHFSYRDEIKDINNWEVKEIILQNIGKTTIEDCFLHLPYKKFPIYGCFFNIYGKNEFFNSNTYYGTPFYYSESLFLSRFINPGENIKLKIYWFKYLKPFEFRMFDIYMTDIKDNYWKQEAFIKSSEQKQNTLISSHYEYGINYRGDCVKWYIYDSMFFSSKVVKDFRSFNIEKKLEDRKQKCWNMESKSEEFQKAIKSGKIRLKS